MRSVRVIPCLDVDAGRVVKGVNFVDLKEAGDPVVLASRYDEMGADELVFLDITASSDARDTMVDVVARTAEQVFIPLTVGGGIRTVEDARRMLRAGADKVSVMTAAIERPALIAEIAEVFGSQCVVVAIDARRVGDVTAPDRTSVGGTARASMATTTHCEPNTSAISAIKAGRWMAAVMTLTLSAPARSMRRASSTLRMPPPTVSGMNTCSAVRRTTSTIVSRSSDDAVMSRKTISSAPISS